MDDVPFLLPALPDRLAACCPGSVGNRRGDPRLVCRRSWYVLGVRRRAGAADRSARAGRGSGIGRKCGVKRAGSMPAGSRGLWRTSRTCVRKNVMVWERSSCWGRRCGWLIGVTPTAAPVRAHEFVRRFDAVRRGLPPELTRTRGSRSVRQPAARAGQHPRPVAFARFARQRSGMILLGFMLTLATTGRA